MSAWPKQKAWQVKKLGADKASWYCEWNEPDGTRRAKSCGPGPRGKRNAQRMADRIKAELLTGTYSREAKTTWEEFRKLYEDRVLAGMKPNSADQIRYTFDSLERLCKPKLVNSITNSTIDSFIAKRRKERGRNPGSKIKIPTINRDLGNLRTVLRKAVKWGIIGKVPDIQLLKEPKKLPNYVTVEHFTQIYKSCNVATKPDALHFSPPDWWRGLLVMAQMTGWRISELLALKWSDVDLDAGTAITRHADNKGGRDEVVNLHEVVVEHLRPLMCFDSSVFPWDKSHRGLYDQFTKIQTAAGIWFPCPDASDPTHGKCTQACHRYSFHDERRAFATLNAENLTREALQVLMRHRDANTTDRYINYARQVKPAVAKLHVPEILKMERA